MAATTEPDKHDEGTLGLTEPVAIFAGLKRPRNNRRSDQQTVVYITNPARNYVYPNRNEFIGGPVRVPVPIDSVFATYVDFGSAAVDEIRSMLSYKLPGDVSGVVIDWEWVTASPSDPLLPVNSTGHDPRYARKVWDGRGH